MQITDIIAIAAIIVIIGSAAAYIIKAKSNGRKCIGCPESSSCSANGNCKGCSSACGKSAETADKNKT